MVKKVKPSAQTSTTSSEPGAVFTESMGVFSCPRLGASVRRSSMLQLTSLAGDMESC